MMDFITKSVASIVNSIQQSAILSVRSLKNNVFTTRISNLPSIQKISGEVKVDQSKTEKELKDIGSLVGRVRTDILGLKFPTKIEVTNFPKPEAFPDFPKEIKVTNIPEPKEFPKEFSVTNQPTKELVNINNSVNKLSSEIKKLKLDPTINVSTPNPVVVPAPSVNITQQEIDYKKMAESIEGTQKEINYDKLATAIGKEVAGSMVTVGGGNSSSNAYPDGRTGRALIDDARHLQVDVLTTPETSPLPTGAATEAKQDDIITHLPLNDETRLKVSTLPGMPEVCSGILTTTAAAATDITGTGCVGGTGFIAVDVSRASNVMFSLQNTGTVNMAAGQFAIEASLDSTNGTDGTWIGIQAVRSNANTIVTNTGTLTANVGLGAGFGFEASVNANMWFRLRVTTNVTTGAAAKWTILRGAYATEPIPAAQASATQAVSLAAAATAIAKAEDSASASANVGVPPMVVRADTTQANAGVSANGDYAFMFCDVDGRLYTNSMITGKTSDTTYQTPRLDVSTHTLQTIDYAHHEIHAGSHFMYTDCLTLASAGTQDYLITTPNTTTWTHLSFVLEGSAITALDVYEASDKTGTTLQTIFNNDRNSATTSVNTIHKGTSGGTTDGTKIWCHKSGSAINQSISGASSGQDSEIILKQNTKYIFRVTSGTADNLVNLALEWYEHTNRAA